MRRPHSRNTLEIRGFRRYAPTVTAGRVLLVLLVIVVIALTIVTHV